ncbi:MAG TPA: glycerophosphodiester phosphodiesterase [Polaromonas sp.]|uniref:glycerophosphodiester phosphodiesterase n=1 Tax=Polaromonas sp. UBA4122 TaxID=1947074 RepID=UPI000EC73B53|nr:glycerophosphodiester phosphodiesterase [Polaromonas sp. UBA4122]HAL40777.1 glycerophosphodiester phosphodiesterase [Polaromonas sp.]
MEITANNWPYPYWVAHRGAGKLAPENTLAAFRRGASHGYRMFECDVKLSADGMPFLLHDDTLERTTNGQGVAGEHTWEVLSKLDAGRWHSPEFAGETLPRLDSIARYCLDHGYFLNIEIKPTPGLESHTGTVVAFEAARLWKDAAVPPIPPLLTSFQPLALAAARAAQPQLPRGLLLDELRAGWLDTARQLECIAIVCNHTLWNADTVSQAKKAGFRLLSYTVNDQASARRLIDLGTDGIITDRVDAFKPDE